MLMGVGEGGVVKEGEVGDVGKFLNRILGLKVHQQNLVSARPQNSPSLSIMPLFDIPKSCGKFCRGRNFALFMSQYSS